MRADRQPGRKRSTDGVSQLIEQSCLDRCCFVFEMRARPVGRGLDYPALCGPATRLGIVACRPADRAVMANRVLLRWQALFESGHDYGFDRIAVTYVDEAVQRERILARPGMTVEKMETLLARQMPQAEKKERADWLFDTTMPIAQIEADVAALVNKLKAERQDG